MPSLKKLTKELARKSYIIFSLFRLLGVTFALHLATLIFSKTRLCSGPFLECKDIPKGFRSNFHPSTFTYSCRLYHRQIECAQNSFSRNIMRITIRSTCQKRNDFDKQILNCRSELSKTCPTILVKSIRTKIHELISKLFQHLQQIKTHKLEQLIRPPATYDLSLESEKAVFTISENLQLSDSEISVLGKGLNIVPIAKTSDEFSVKQDVEKVLRRVQLKAFFHDKEGNGQNIFETLQVRKSKWTPPSSHP